MPLAINCFAFIFYDPLSFSIPLFVSFFLEMLVHGIGQGELEHQGRTTDNSLAVYIHTSIDAIVGRRQVISHTFRSYLPT